MIGADRYAKSGCTAGGRMQVHLYAGAYGTTNGPLTAVTTAAQSKPTISGSDAFFPCVAYIVVCNHGSGSPLDYSGPVNNNAGKCVPVGTDPGSGALMFDWQQPCLQTENVDIAVPTAGRPDGGHELSVTVTDAAGNASAVFDQTISTANPQITPRDHGRIRAEFVISWRWTGSRTTMRSIAVRGLPHQASIAVSCRGHHCPRLRRHTARGRGVRTLPRSLAGRHYTAGDRLLITVAQGRRRERVALTIRNGRVPSARLLRP